MKKRLLSLILTICILVATPCTAMAADIENGTNSLDSMKVVHELQDEKRPDAEKANAHKSEIVLTTRMDGMSIQAKNIDGVNYLFLPANADLTSVELYFEGGKSDAGNTGNITLKGSKGSVKLEEAVNILALAEQDSENRYVLGAAIDGGGQYNFYLVQGAEIPTIYIESDNQEKNREWVDQSKKNKAAANMQMVSKDGKAIYNGELTEIKARGNSTFVNFDKKAYQIKLKDKTDLLGTGEKVKTWVLLANYADATIMHDKLFKDLAAEIGMVYVASCDWVNLYYDGEYRGVYLLSEKNSVNSTSVDITDMEEAYEAVNTGYGDDMKVVEATNKYGQKYLYTEGLKEPEDITGGYLIERNLDFLDEVNGFYTKQGGGFNIKSPEYIGKEAMTYINEYYQDFEDAVFATDEEGNYTGYNEETGKYYYEYVDKTSLIQAFLLQELAINPDGFLSSFYFYKDTGSIMYTGPIWDQDITLGTGWNKYNAPDAMHYRYLQEGLMKIPNFQEALKEYYTVILAPELEHLIAENGKIDEYKAKLEANADMNYRLWPYVNIGQPTHKYHIWNDTNYDFVIEDLEHWLAERLKVLDDLYETEVVTRGMFISMLARAEGCDMSPQNGEDWKQPAIRWAVENGISDGLRMDAPITREEMATMLYRCEGKPSADSAGAGSLGKFTDGKSTSSWAKEAMQWAVSEGIYSGNTDGSLKPRSAATADEAVQIMTNYKF